MKNILLSFIILMTLVSCKNENSLEKEIAKINTKIEVERFDTYFSKTNYATFPTLKKAYPFMFSEKYKDSFWIDKVNDTLQKQLFKEVEKTFENSFISYFRG